MRPINVTKALTIPGWMAKVELKWLAKQARKHTCIVEIGSWRGCSTRALAENTDGVVFAVDTWQGSPEHMTTPDSSGDMLAGKPSGWLLEEFKANLKDCENVSIVQATSLQAAHILRNRRFDMIFIDALHDYESVKADIAAWRPLLSNGGLLCGHDYKSCESVTKAVNESIATVGEGAGRIWYEKQSR